MYNSIPCSDMVDEGSHLLKRNFQSTSKSRKKSSLAGDRAELCLLLVGRRRGKGGLKQRDAKKNEKVEISSRLSEISDTLQPSSQQTPTRNRRGSLQGPGPHKR